MGGDGVAVCELQAMEAKVMAARVGYEARHGRIWQSYG
jgi:hypothetical protein